MNHNVEFYASLHTAEKAAELAFNSLSTAIGHYRKANDLEHPQMTELDKKMCALMAEFVSTNSKLRSIKDDAAIK